MSVQGKRVSDIYVPSAGGLAWGTFRNGGETLSKPQQHILRAVYHAGGGDLIISSVNRPGAGYHGQAAAIDFGQNDPLEFNTGWELMKQRWPGGVGLGKPPGADRHLHVDARQYVGAPRDRWYSYFIELDRRGGTIPATPDRLRDLAPDYGVAPGGVVERIERTSSNFKEAVKIGSMAIIGFAGISLLSTILKVRNRGQF